MAPNDTVTITSITMIVATYGKDLQYYNSTPVLY